MDIRLPKVPHSWREFGREIGIIVVGVLIALFFEQMAQAWEWNRKVRAADRAMRVELLSDDGPQIYMRAVLHPCIEAQLDSIRASVESGAPRAEIDRRIDGYWTPFFTYNSIAYTTQPSQVSLHFDPNRIRSFTVVYSSMPVLDQTNALEGGTRRTALARQHYGACAKPLRAIFPAGRSSATETLKIANRSLFRVHASYSSSTRCYPELTGVFRVRGKEIP